MFITKVQDSPSVKPSLYTFNCTLDNGFPTILSARLSTEWLTMEEGQGVHMARVEGVFNRAYQSVGLSTVEQEVDIEIRDGRLHRVERPGLLIRREKDTLVTQIENAEQLAAAFACMNFWARGTVGQRILEQNAWFQYLPVPEWGGHGIGLQSTREYVTFASQQSIDEEKYERKAGEVIELIFGKEIAAHYMRYNQLFLWRGGLMTNLTVPGDRCGLDSDGDLRWNDHNCDTARQVAAIFVLANYWLNDIEARIKASQ